MTLVSVVVPFRDEISQLTRCLQGIRAQSYPRELIKVYAVENSDTCATTALASEFPEIVWLHESQPGSYAARNRALAEVSNGVIAFTDSDCVPEPRWIENGVTTLLQSTTSIVGGRVQLMDPASGRLNPYEVFEEEMFGMSNQRKLIEKNGFAATANLFVHAEVFTKIGCFNGELKSSGDKEWCQRAVKFGYQLGYADNAVVQHPRRSTFNSIHRKSMRLVGGKMMLMLTRREPWWRIAQDIYWYSPLNYRLHIFALTKSRMSRLNDRLLFCLLIEFMSARASAEKLRVLCGGTASRG